MRKHRVLLSRIWKQDGKSKTCVAKFHHEVQKRKGDSK
jgi:hypothetical protein